MFAGMSRQKECKMEGDRARAIATLKKLALDEAEKRVMPMADPYIQQAEEFTKENINPKVAGTAALLAKLGIDRKLKLKPREDLEIEGSDLGRDNNLRLKYRPTKNWEIEAAKEGDDKRIGAFYRKDF